MITQLLIVLFLTLLNGYFAASEMAFVTIDESALNEFDDKKTKETIKEIMKYPTNFLATIQVGITLAGFFSSATAAVAISEPFGTVLNSLGVPYYNQVAIIVVTLILSYFVLIFGELVPKRIALSAPITVLKLTLRPLIVVMTIFRPFVFILSASTSLIVKMLNLKEEEDEVTEENIKLLVRRGRESGTINVVEEQMIENVFEFDETLVKDIMTKEEDFYFINIEDFNEDAFFNSFFSRVPVKKNGQYIGILHLKDYVTKGSKNVEEILRPMNLTSQDEPIDDLFMMMQRINEHMRLIVDDQNNVVGLVTTEDIIEEVFGPIYDEY